METQENRIKARDGIFFRLGLRQKEKGCLELSDSELQELVIWYIEYMSPGQCLDLTYMIVTMGSILHIQLPSVSAEKVLDAINSALASGKLHELITFKVLPPDPGGITKRKFELIRSDKVEPE
jgi:hypothetical protein